MIEKFKPGDWVESVADGGAQYGRVTAIYHDRDRTILDLVVYGKEDEAANWRRMHDAPTRLSLTPRQLETAGRFMCRMKGIDPNKQTMVTADDTSIEWLPAWRRAANALKQMIDKPHFDLFMRAIDHAHDPENLT
jgi:hypothetical protein